MYAVIIFIFLYMIFIIYKLISMPNNIYIIDNELIIFKKNRLYMADIYNIRGPFKIPHNFKFENGNLNTGDEIIEGF